MLSVQLSLNSGIRQGLCRNAALWLGWLGCLLQLACDSNQDLMTSSAWLSVHASVQAPSQNQSIISQVVDNIPPLDCGTARPPRPLTSAKIATMLRRHMALARDTCPSRSLTKSLQISLARSALRSASFPGRLCMTRAC
jgi:hypothetical protein